MPKYTKALVTGGAGFIGSHIADALVRRRIKTYVVDDLSSGSVKHVNPNAHFTKLSIVSPQFGEYVKRLKPDVVFHCAAQVNLRTSLEDPRDDALRNILGTVQLVDAARACGIKKIILCSSAGVYPPTNRFPISEKLVASPLSPYGISKRAAEMYLAYAYEVLGIPGVSLRFANVYGPRQGTRGEGGVIAVFAKKMAQGEPVTVFGNGKNTRDFVYVDDVARAAILAMNRSVVGEFNIGTGRETDVNTLYKKIAKLTGYKLPARTAPLPAFDVARNALDPRKARTYLGWEPRVKLDEGLAKTVKWFASPKS
ncbi:NAD-dependent epimerase/dehydratase family protein [Candidatus Parcubacteria bacterium]|nr:NAD-dependent epimerase/dehydratase family protein [Candidatus Parcubacteria bacterium]